MTTCGGLDIVDDLAHLRDRFRVAVPDAAVNQDVHWIPCVTAEDDQETVSQSLTIHTNKRLTRLRRGDFLRGLSRHSADLPLFKAPGEAWRTVRPPDESLDRRNMP